MEKSNSKIGRQTLRILMLYGMIAAGTIAASRHCEVPEIDQSLAKSINDNLGNTYLDELSVIENNTWAKIYSLERSINIVEELQDLPQDNESMVIVNYSEDQQNHLRQLNEDEVLELLKQYNEETRPLEKKYILHALKSIKNHHMSKVYNEGLYLSKSMLGMSVKGALCESLDLDSLDYKKVDICQQVSGESPNVILKGDTVEKTDNYSIALDSVYGQMIQSIYNIQSREERINNNESEPFSYKEVEQIAKDSINLVKVSAYSKTKLEENMFGQVELDSEDSYSTIKQKVKTK